MKDRRFEVNCSVEQKKEIQLAAESAGLTVSAWVLMVALAKAREAKEGK